MQGFLAVLARATELVDFACENPAFPGAHGDAEDALQDLRDAYKSLDADEKEAARPMAALLAKRLSGAHPQAAPAIGTRPDVMELAFAEAVTAGGPEQIRLNFEPTAPSRIFTDPDPTPEKLLAHFGYERFRTGQREAVAAAISGRDSLILMPTGGGKSLCYQLPGMATSKLTIVISPLIALILDQYQRLARDGHPAVMLASGLSDDHNRDALEQIRDHTARMVFCSPERFASHSFLEAVSSREVGLFVVDEAHCVSEWGHDFRPDYLRLHAARERLGNPPVMACTATATPEVAQEIANRLHLNNALFVQGGFDRPNLSFDVFAVGGAGAVERKHMLLQTALHMAANRPAIVYCGTRKDVEQVTERLQEAGLAAVGYHAGMVSAARKAAQNSFMTGTSDIVVATNAFGMGVDKSDVRAVIHWAIPTSVEGYYQEAGRAGRDGQPARAVLLSMRADLGRLVAFNKRRSTSVEAVQAYLARLRAASKGKSLLISQPEDDVDRLALAIAERTRALTIEPAFGGKIKVEITGALDARAALEATEIAKQRGWDAYRAVERFVFNEGLCRRKQILDHFGDARAPAPSGRCCDVCDPPTWLPPNALPAQTQTPRSRAASKPKAKRTSDKTSKGKATSTTPGSQRGVQETLTGEAGLNNDLLEALRSWRKNVAGGRPAYTVAKNHTLEEIARLLPQDPESLQAINGVGPTFILKHGDKVLKLVAAHQR